MSINSRHQINLEKLFLELSQVFNEETDWSVFNHGRPVTKKKFTQTLGDFGIKPVKGRKSNVFYVADIYDACRRYLKDI